MTIKQFVSTSPLDVVTVSEEVNGVTQKLSISNVPQGYLGTINLRKVAQVGIVRETYAQFFIRLTNEKGIEVENVGKSVGGGGIDFVIEIPDKPAGKANMELWKNGKFYKEVHASTGLTLVGVLEEDIGNAYFDIRSSGTKSSGLQSSGSSLQSSRPLQGLKVVQIGPNVGKNKIAIGDPVPGTSGDGGAVTETAPETGVDSWSPWIWVAIGVTAVLLILIVFIVYWKPVGGKSTASTMPLRTVRTVTGPYDDSGFDIGL